MNVTGSFGSMQMLRRLLLSTTLALRPIIGGGIYLHCDSPQVFVQDEKGDVIFYCSAAWFETSYTAVASSDARY